MYVCEIEGSNKTWLTSLILNNKIIPYSYNLYHSDHSDGYGGVAIH